MVAIGELLDALTLEPAGEGRFVGTNVPAEHGVVFGGQLLGQSIVAARAGHEDMTAKTVHTVFARAGRPELPLEIEVDAVQSGRTFASSRVTISQDGRTCTSSIVLLHADDGDLIRHADAPPRASRPDEIATRGETGDWEIRVVGDVDLSDPDAVGPPELDVWTRFAGAPDDPLIGQALLAYATDGFLIGTAMRPHDGVGQAQAHRTLSTGVISHTLTFHEPVDAGDWLLLAHHSPYAGRGRSYGRADVFTEDGRLVASFVQDAMIRPQPAPAEGRPQQSGGQL
jgi:acyl-CoA thioesterase